MNPKQPVSVAGIEFDAMIERTEDHSATAPKYPIDAGYSVTDNVALDPLILKMTLYVTATPVTWLARHGSGFDRVETVCNQLLSAFSSRILVGVVTPDKSYSNMVITHISIKQSSTIGYAREIPIELKEVTVTSAKKAAIPEGYARAGATMENAGAAATSKTSGSSGSVSGASSGDSSGSSGSGAGQNNGTLLYNIADGIGNKTGWYSLGN